MNDHSAVYAAPKDGRRAVTGQIVTYPDAEREAWAGIVGVGA